LHYQHNLYIAEKVHLVGYNVVNTIQYNIRLLGLDRTQVQH